MYFLPLCFWLCMPYSLDRVAHVDRPTAYTHIFIKLCCRFPFGLCAVVVKVRCVLSCYLLLKHLSCTFFFVNVGTMCCRPYQSLQSLPPETFHLQHKMTEHNARNNFFSTVLHIYDGWFFVRYIVAGL